MKKRKYFNNKLPSDAEYFGTPDYAIDPIIKYIPKGVKHIWEPTAGQCNIVNRLKHHGYTLTATDKYPQMKSIVRHDFLLDPLLCLLYTSPSPRDRQKSRMPSSA